ncbi:MAG: sterol desaturase family protein [Archangium sp.]|nr:sterol desaturase family protein [Archangium sp.]
MSTWPMLLEWAATALSALVVPLLALELWALHRRGQLTGPVVRELLASASPVVPTLALSGLTVGWALTVFQWAQQVSPLHVATTPWSAAAVVVLGDFTYYWEHRCAHRVRGYWAVAHSVHHSSPDYNQATGLRVSFVDGFISPLFYVPLVVLGFEPLLVGAAIFFNAAFQQWIHTELVGRLPWLDGWLNTPSNHRVHHASQAA